MAENQTPAPHTPADPNEPSTDGAHASPVPAPRSAVRSLLRLWPYAREARWRIFGSMAAAGLASLSALAVPVVRSEEHNWAVDALAAPHVGGRSEKQLIAAFCDKIAELNPQLVTFNGNSFDLPVLRYHAMIHGISAPGLAATSSSKAVQGHRHYARLI